MAVNLNTLAFIRKGMTGKLSLSMHMGKRPENDTMKGHTPKCKIKYLRRHQFLIIA